MLKIPSQHVFLPLLYFHWTFERSRIEWHLLPGFLCQHNLNSAAVLRKIPYLQMLRRFCGYTDHFHRCCQIRINWFLIIPSLSLSLLIRCFFLSLCSVRKQSCLSETPTTTSSSTTKLRRSSLTWKSTTTIWPRSWPRSCMARWGTSRHPVASPWMMSSRLVSTILVRPRETLQFRRRNFFMIHDLIQTNSGLQNYKKVMVQLRWTFLSFVCE